MSDSPFDIRDIALAIDGSAQADILAQMIREKPWGDWIIFESGCGVSKFAIYYALRYRCVALAMDVDEAQLLRGYRLLRSVEEVVGTRVHVTHLQGNVLNIPYADNTFSLSFSEGVIEHWTRDDPARMRVITEMVRVSRDWVGIITNDAEGPRTKERAETTHHTYQTMPEKEEPYTKEELKENMEKAGLSNVKVIQFADPGTQEFLISCGRKQPKT